MSDVDLSPPDDGGWLDAPVTDADAPDAPPGSERHPLDPANRATTLAPTKKKKGKPKPLVVAEPPSPSDEWQRGLARDQYGAPKATLANVMQVLSRHPEWLGVIVYDAFATCVRTTRPPPMRPVDRPEQCVAGEWADVDSTRTAAWYAAAVGAEPKPSVVDVAVQSVAHRTVIHPVREYLASVQWDDTARLDLMLSTYFGAPDTAYTRAVGSRWMLSAVARVMRPGCQADCMLVLEGAQGGRKSTGIEALVPDVAWFSDTLPSVGEKDSYQGLRSKWIIEIGELDAMRGREVSQVKRFISGRTDNYRPSFGRRNQDFPRQCVFAGSTNERNYLADKTGNRRFWPVRCGAVQVEDLRAIRDQLWAEALTRYLDGEPWYVDTPELRRLCEAEQKRREHEDDWLVPVTRWLDAPTVPDGTGARRIVDLDDGITTYDVLTGALGMAPDRVEHRHTIRAGNVLRDLGWTPVDDRRRATDGAMSPRRYRRAEPHGDLDIEREAIQAEGEP